MLRNCNHCGNTYPVRTGHGGGGARQNETPETHPFDQRTHTGIKVGNEWWVHGAHCSEGCYSAAYYEPPAPSWNF